MGAWRRLFGDFESKTYHFGPRYMLRDTKLSKFTHHGNALHEQLGGIVQYSSDVKFP